MKQVPTFLWYGLQSASLDEVKNVEIQLTCLQICNCINPGGQGEEMNEDKFIKGILGQLSSSAWKRSRQVVTDLKKNSGIDRGDLALVYLIELEKADCVESREGEPTPAETMLRGSWWMLEWKLTGVGRERAKRPAKQKEPAGLVPAGA